MSLSLMPPSIASNSGPSKPYALFHESGDRNGAHTRQSRPASTTIGRFALLQVPTATGMKYAQFSTKQAEELIWKLGEARACLRKLRLAVLDGEKGIILK